MVLEDDRESDDYVLVSVVSGDDPDMATALDTFIVRANGAATAASPALYTSLDAHPVAGSSDDLAVATEAVARVEQLRPEATVAAIAYVRGIATPEINGAWHSARLQLRADLEAAGVATSITRALPGQGWDWMTGHGEPTFWSARPGRGRCSASTRREAGRRKRRRCPVHRPIGRCVAERGTLRILRLMPHGRCCDQ